jgi:hypothetical protein
MTRHDTQARAASRTLVLTSTACTLMAVACTGGVIGGNPGGKAGGPSTGGPVDMPGAGPLPPPPDQVDGVSCTGPAVFTPARIWRISDEQFATAVKDLVGIAPAEISTTGRQKSQFVDFAERFNIDPALTADIRASVEGVARQAVADLPRLLGCAQVTPACVDSFIDKFASRAFRRPLAAGERTELKALYDNGAADGPAIGVAMLLEAVLQSPSFLYRSELGQGAVAGKPVELTAWEMASAISFLLLNSIPDPELWKAAEDGSIMKSDGLTRQVQRLLALPRVQDNLTRAFVKWVGLGDGINPDLMEKETDLTPELKASMERETSLFFHNLLTKAGTLTDVLTSSKGFVDQRLASHYAVTAPGATATNFAEVNHPANQRSGILTQAAILARYSLGHAVVFRGKYVRDELLCGEIPAPPNIPEVDQENMASAGLPEREQVRRRLENATCGACHRLMDTIGLGFMNYDALARYRSSEGGQPVDARGSIFDSPDTDGDFMDAIDLGKKLAASKAVRGCMQEKIFSYAFGRLSETTDRCELVRIDSHVQQNGGRLSELVAAIIYSSAFRYRTGGN